MPVRTPALAVSLCLSTVCVADAQGPFWAPRVPPRAQYRVDVTYSAATQRLEGTATIRFTNETNTPIHRLAVRWFGDVLQLRVKGALASGLSGTQSVRLVDLPQPIAPGAAVDLVVAYGAPWKLNEKSGSAITSFLSPRLWWGFGTHDDYEVTLHVPPGYAVATTGRLDPATGVSRAEGVRAFGLFIGRGYLTAERDVDGIQVRAVFTPAGRPCAELLLDTAADAIRHYRKQLGMYPQTALSIVPGAEQPMGGYPAATGLVVVHGQERMPDRTNPFWRWIIAHEIGHQYWGEHALAEGADPLSPLMLGLGLHIDRGYRLARHILDAGNLEQNYVNGAEADRDAPLETTDEARDEITWDFNNIIAHGKSAAVLNALESVLGGGTVASIERRCLREYAGRPLGWRDFQRVAEIESGQSLGWFFDQWVRSTRTADYRVSGRTCAPSGAVSTCTVEITRIGSLRMPIMVAARFEDGSEQRQRTERLADVDVLTFRAKAPLTDVVVDPDALVAMRRSPSTQVRELRAQIRDLPWTGAGASALGLYRRAREAKLEDSSSLLKLSLALYDAGHYEEALEELKQLEALATPQTQFVALVWEGHVLDLLGRRTDAIARYKAALDVPGSPSMRHDQYGLVLNKDWAAERVRTPFTR
jgi:tetratricopeptide (TPR) repeat protein